MMTFRHLKVHNGQCNAVKREHAWQRRGGMCSKGGHAWRKGGMHGKRGACVAGETATAVGSMLECILVRLKNLHFEKKLG